MFVVTIRINEDEIEQLQLLKKVPVVDTKKRDLSEVLDDKKQMVSCNRCGYLNSRTSTVCKECNALLKGAELFSPHQGSVYYSIVSCK